MRWLWTIALLLTLPRAAQTQQVGQPILVIADSVRTVLAKDWTMDPYQTERGYCVTITRAIAFEGDVIHPVYEVVGARAAIMFGATPYQSMFTCPVSPNIVTLHTHPPSTCTRDPSKRLVCLPGGDDAYECFASDGDERGLDHLHEAFGLIQCDTHAIVAYYPKTVPPKTPGK